MFRGENNMFMAVFRRRNSSRDLTSATTEDDEDEQPVELAGATEEEKEAESDLSVTTHLMIQHTKSFHDGYGSEPEEEDNAKYPAIPLKANPVKDSLDGSTCSHPFFEGESGSINDSTSANTKDSKSVEKPKQKLGKPKAWTTDAAKLGWTPGRVKLQGKNRFALEPVVALTDTLDEIS